MSFSSFAQSPADIPSFEFKTEEDYKKYENEVLKSANFILQTPIDKDALKLTRHAAFIMKWMTGTPDYSFALDEDFIDLTKGNEDLPSVYLSALVKSALDNKVNGLDINPIAKETFLDYCADENNNVKPNRKVKKLLKARKKKG